MQRDIQRIVVVDRSSGDLLSFNTDGESMGREAMSVFFAACGAEAGFGVVGRKSVRRLNPDDLSVEAEYVFETEADPVSSGRFGFAAGSEEIEVKDIWLVQFDE